MRMPNWVCCGFTVTGDADEVDRFRNMMFRPMDPPDHGSGAGLPGGGLVLDFGAIIPMPAEAARRDHEDWAVRNWGTKWNAQNLLVTRSAVGSVTFQFDTAWDFPTPVFEALSREFPALLFSGSAFEDNGAFELVGEFNGSDPWGPGEIEWIIDTSRDGDG